MRRNDGMEKGPVLSSRVFASFAVKVDFHSRSTFSRRKCVAQEIQGS